MAAARGRPRFFVCPPPNPLPTGGGPAARPPPGLPRLGAPFSRTPLLFPERRVLIFFIIFFKASSGREAGPGVTGTQSGALLPPGLSPFSGGKAAVRYHLGGFCKNF